ncbi:hypothetical protein [Halalkalibacter krulwichiae]|uniref:Competence protein CoiA-like family protein n=2 Tax=Halalkalibacter krulwichiae TaxID=199441 RepID=A0A1X9MHW6_9BACI|nr:hypothetical protein [Halalkalibacter krulwichiae]ARK30112.1 hypothetical protein BkAM31D_09725 [Halalkalibacter krulwichiae]
MDSAYLHNSVFNIELKRRELEQRNLARSEVKRWFEDNYRVFSKKSAFTCLCCNKPVNMNLTKDEGRPFYFRRNDESECSYSENTKTYDKHVSKLEDKSKKDIGLTIFREKLEGELKPYNVEIERGYHYKKKLSFIPDFIIKFPNSEEHWAIDYFTAIDQGLTSGSYARHLSKRMKTYKEEGFKPFSFVDYSWLSFLEETNKGTLLTAETYVTSKTHEDYQWDTFLEQNMQGRLLDFFTKVTGATMREFNSRSIAYVDVFNRLCTIFRFIPIAQHDRNITFYKLSSSEIPLAQALAMNADHNHFVLSKENEDDRRNDFLNALFEKKQQFELEQQGLREEQGRTKAEEERVKQEEKKQRSRLRAEAAEMQMLRQRAEELEDEQVEREMQERARRAALRPIEEHPEYWNERSRRNSKYSNYTYQQNPSITTHEKTEDSIEKKKKEKVRDLLLSQPITGELYIDGDKKSWRIVILKWINENQSGDSLVVSLQKIISHMKSEGISFNQSDKLVKYTIKHFLEFYRKTIKTELKKMIELNIKE